MMLLSFPRVWLPCVFVYYIARGRFRLEFQALAREGIIRYDFSRVNSRRKRKRNRVDMFCLWRIYAGPIKDALDRHCRATRVMAKRGNRTRNPFFPKGVHSPYDLMMEDHHGKDLTDDLIATINEEVGKFWGDASDQGDSDDEENRRRDEGPAAFDDPLPTVPLRLERERRFRQLNIPQTIYHAQYREFRRITLALMP